MIEYLVNTPPEIYLDFKICEKLLLPIEAIGN